MSNDKTTLADVQPGGRVRLGDQAERVRFEAWAGKFWSLEKGWWVGQMRYHSDYAQRTWEAWQAALSAQPSPGGQGDALLESLVARWRNHAEEIGVSDNLLCQKIANCTMRHAAELQAVLAARQPLGEAVLWVSPEVLDAMAIHRAQDFPAGGMGLACPAGSATVPLYLAPPAQAVDLAQEPMFYIQDTRQFVGNCPVWWGPNGSGYVTRLDEAGRYTEQEAVKQNRCRETDIPWPCAEIEAIAWRTVDFQHMRPRAERLAELALIDSQAVGNG